MKNKRLTLMLIVFAVFVLVISFTSALFMLSSVKVNFLSSCPKFVSKENMIIESANFEFGKSVFFLKKDIYKNNLEINNPYLKVINIETIFPNKLKINCIQRESLFCIKNFEYYYILDDDFKVLEKTDSSKFLTIQYIDLGQNDYINLEIGQVCYELMNNYKQLPTALKEWNDNNSFLKQEILKINSKNNKLIIKMNNYQDLIIKDYEKALSDKFNIVISAFLSNKLTMNDYIYVYEDSQNKLVCVSGNY